MLPCEIRFKYDIEKFVNALAYLSSQNVPDLDKLKVTKLIYYADKLHLQRYGRPITGDEYFRLPYGPIPSVSLDVMEAAENGECSYFNIRDTNVELFTDYLAVERKKGKYPTFSTKKPPDLDVFSDSEIEILDKVIRDYGRFSGLQLIDMTHKEATWINTSENAPIDFRLFLDELAQEEKKALIEWLEHNQEDREIFDLAR